MKLAAPLLLVVLVVSGWGWEHHVRTKNEAALSVVASELAGRSVHVSCQSLWKSLVDVDNRLGDVPFPNGYASAHTHLTRAVCGKLTHFRKVSSHPELDCLTRIDWSRFTQADASNADCIRDADPEAEALMTLAHESMHLRGWADEATAQCYGIQEVAYTVERLGGTLAEGKAVASFMLAVQGGMPEEYQSGECRAGGDLDLHPDTPDFPTEAPPGPPPAGLYGPQLGT
ncbi:MAG TPA: hypothetical protein VLU96_01115 [Gaiellaceae bacterium]|nr:hypothetical protein [Gaiellaceae bacterium]